MPRRSALALLLLAGLAGGCCRTPCRPDSCTGGGAPVPAPAPQVLLATMTLTVPETEAAGVLGAAREASERSYAVVSAAEAGAIGERAKRAPGIVVLAMPAIVTTLGEEATISVVGENDSAGRRGDTRLRYLASPLPEAATLALDVSYERSGKSASLRVGSMKSGETVVVTLRPPAGGSSERVLLLLEARLLPQRDALTTR